MASESTTLITGVGVGLVVGIALGLAVALHLARRGMVTEFTYTEDGNIRTIVEKPLAA